MSNIVGGSKALKHGENRKGCCKKSVLRTAVDADVSDVGVGFARMVKSRKT